MFSLFSVLPAQALGAVAPARGRVQQAALARPSPEPIQPSVLVSAGAPAAPCVLPGPRVPPGLGQLAVS
jgi:hypothetical protein